MFFEYAVKEWDSYVGLLKQQSQALRQDYIVMENNIPDWLMLSLTVIQLVNNDQIFIHVVSNNNAVCLVVYGTLEWFHETNQHVVGIVEIIEVNQYTWTAN